MTMEKRIEQYVNYQFRFDQRTDIEDIKAEMIANLIDRYHDLVSEGMDEESAYIEAIKRMGDATQTKEAEVENSFKEKPSWARLMIITATVLAVVGLVVVLFNAFIGLLIGLASITLFITSSYHLYAESQYERAKNHNIDLQRINFVHIMKYLNKNYLLWVINLSVSFTGIIISYIVIASGESLIYIIAAGNFGQVILLYLIIWGLIFGLLLWIALTQKEKVIAKFEYLLGDRYDAPSNNNQSLNKIRKFLLGIKFPFEATYLFLTLLLFYSSTIYTSFHDYSRFYVYAEMMSEYLYLIIPVMMHVLLAIIALFNFFKRKISNLIMLLLTIFTFIAYTVVIIILDNQLSQHLINADAYIYTIIFSIISIIVYLLRVIYRKKHKKED